MDSFYFSSWYIDDIVKKDKSKKSQLQSLQSKLQADAKKHGFSLESKTPEMKQRDKKVVCKTFHGAGLVVPVDANDVGYRELPETPGTCNRKLQSLNIKVVCINDSSLE